MVSSEEVLWDLDRDNCAFFVVDVGTLKPRCLHPKRECDFLVRQFLSAPACGRKRMFVFPDVNCVGCGEKFAKCCFEKCPERR